jgi:hypothetical protein
VKQLKQDSLLQEKQDYLLTNKMEAFDTYKIYTAVKNHFVLDSYDYFKYNKKINLSYDSFLKRKDKIFFAKLGKRKEDYLENFLVANFLHDPKIWIGELLSEESEARYKNWKRKQESLTYVFKNEVEFMNGWNSEDLESWFSVTYDEHPNIVKMYLRKEISLETFTILNSVLNFTKQYDQQVQDPIYKEVSKLCRKYQPFLKFDKNKAKAILREMVEMKKPQEFVHY